MTDGGSAGDAAGLASFIGHKLISASPVLRHLGVELAELRPGYARMTMTVREDMANTHGACHGGVLFSLGDTCFGFAFNAYNDVAATTQADIRFVAPARVGDRLTAESSELWTSERAGIYDVTITSQSGGTIALLRGYMRKIGGSHIESDAT